MKPTKADRLKALDDLEHVTRIVFNKADHTDDEHWECERLMRRALAVLHAAEREIRDG